MYDLESATAIITGGASGIGRSICLRLANDGANIAVLDTNTGGAEDTAEVARKAGVDARAWAVDVSDETSVAEVFTAVRAWRGEPDILVNSAGIITVGTVEETSTEEWRRIFAVNVEGVFQTCRLASAGMRARGSGKIINISSWFAKTGKPNYGAYSASKSAVMGLTQSLAMELASHGVNVNAVCPGTIFETGLRDHADQLSAAKNLSTARDRAKAIPLGRVGYPDDVARVVAFLASAESAYMTGQSINVDGGLITH
jgi:NAD(P)-dependent dehydrogenase (short-subunit alcohol dehydrogenase family)